MSPRGSSPTYSTRSHENGYADPARRTARAARLVEREQRRQECVAAAVVFWDPAAA